MASHIFRFTQHLSLHHSPQKAQSQWNFDIRPCLSLRSHVPNHHIILHVKFLERVMAAEIVNEMEHIGTVFGQV